MLTEIEALLPPCVHPYLRTWAGGVEIRHPFGRRACRAPNPQDDVAHVLEEIAAREQMYLERCADGKWSRALVMVERPFRPSYLETLIDLHGVQRLLPAVGHIWTDTEGAFEDREIWERIWSRVQWRQDGTPRKTRDRVMTKPERAFLAALPDTLTIYRGFSGVGGEDGFSWTLDHAQAAWFARRFCDFWEEAPYIATMTIAKGGVLAYFGRESEIVIDLWSLKYDRITIEELEGDDLEAAA